MVRKDDALTDIDAPDIPDLDEGSGEEESRPYLVLWGDAVAPREVGISIAVTAAAALSVFLLARHALSALGAEKVVDGYALLAGLVTCVAAGAVSAKLFKPKRTFAESGIDEDRHAVLAELSTPEALARVPAEYVDEMRELGLHESAAENRATSRRKTT